jgi:hypothetical protein
MREGKLHRLNRMFILTNTFVILRVPPDNCKTELQNAEVGYLSRDEAEDLWVTTQRQMKIP